MSMLETAYTMALRAARPALRLAALGEGKLARGVRGRRGAIDRMRAWSVHRDTSRPLVWVHAPSVGEGLQARAVLERFRERDPSAQIVYTFFSPSAERLASSMGADLADYLPLDVPGDVALALDLLRPDVLAFSKTDVWPNLTREAERRGIRVALLSGTLPPSSSRLRGPARALLGPAYRRIDRIAAISREHAARFERLGVTASRVSVMGDAHFDRVLERAGSVDLDSELLRPLAVREAPGGASGADVPVTIVAGSTWPADEERLISVVSALGRAAAAGASRGDPSAAPVRLLLVPHEPTEAHLAESERRLTSAGLRSRRLSALHGPWDDPAEVLLVDSVGALGRLYAVADVAYVGGGWGRAGLHSVLEPAAFGLPIVFGPHHANASEAGDLVELGGAFSVGTPAALASRLSELLRSPDARAAAGAAARRYVEAGRGAADRGAAILEQLLARPRASG